jgi:hypothetical protein
MTRRMGIRHQLRVLICLSVPLMLSADYSHDELPQQHYKRLRDAYLSAVQASKRPCEPRIVTPKDNSTWSAAYLLVEWDPCDIEVCNFR